MAVVGFDFGNESCVIACIRRKQIEVLQNEMGSRKTPTCVGFSGNQRILAGDGIASYNSNYKNSIIPIKRLLGRTANERFRQEEEFYLTSTIKEEKSGLMIHVKYDSKSRQFPPESLTAMQLGRLKRTAEANLGMPVKDCVIGVPAFWNDQQRRAMMCSAKICGLNVMRLMNETTAVALNYGILRPITTDIKVLFVDMGYSSLNAALVSFGKGKLQVLGTSADPNLGGRNFDKLLMDHFHNYIQNKYKMDVYSQPKATLKLAKESTRVKKVLSANKKVTFTVEYIMNDKDVKGEVTREAFEKMATPLLDKILTPLNRLLAECRIDKGELHSLEVVGGAVRMPCVKAKLTEWFEKPLSGTCDGDESIARGCALQCAMLAPFVKVRDFEINDITPYGIQLYWQPYSPDDKRSLKELWSEECQNSPIPPLNPIPSKKMISFKDKTEPFQVIAKYSDESKLPADTEPFLGRWVIDNIPKAVQPSNEGKPPKIKVKFQLDINGIFSVSSATSIESYEVEVEEEIKVLIEEPEEDVKPMEVDGAESSPGDNSENAPATPADPDQPKSETADQDKDQASTTTTTTTEPTVDQTEAKTDEVPDQKSADETKDPSSEKSPDEDKPKDPDQKDGDQKDPSKDEEKKPEEKKPEKKPKYRTEKVMKLKPKKTRTTLPIQEQYVVQMDDSTLQIWRKEELTMMKKDMEIQETNELRNSLEGYVLEMRGRLEGSLGPYMNDTARQSFIKQLNDMEEWLYEDGYDAEKAAFEERLKNLKLTGDPVDKRSDEAKRRPDCIREFNRAVAESKAFANSKDEKYSHIPQEDRDKILKKCGESEEWLKSEVAKQDPLSLADDPVVLCATLSRKKNSIAEYCGSVMNKPKPKPKPKPKAEAKDETKPEDKDENKSKDDKKSETEEKPVDAPAQSNPIDPLDDPTMDLGPD